MKLQEFIAKYNLGESNISEFPSIALNVIEQGIESESLIILAGMNENDNSFEIKEYLDKVIDELDVEVYRSNDAAFVLANYYVDQVEKGELNTIQAIYNIKNECWENNNVTIESKEYVFDSIKFEEIIGPWHEYNEIDEHLEWVKAANKSIKEIKCEIEIKLKNDLLQWKKTFLENELRMLKKRKSSDYNLR